MNPVVLKADVAAIETFCVALTVWVPGVIEAGIAAVTVGDTATIAEGALLIGVVVVAITSTK
ncbi:unannotated protein [freshwater metagenome]|uniref:Unannotated protein n=1 Tax=freshwater metagenome TaxID=449393 RepID=A0A6J6U785_9ZZZZ